MKIAIIGAGFTGLTAAYDLRGAGHDVTVFEKDHNPGGLAIGYKEKDWDWTLEKHYHHWFTNDKSILSLAKKVGYEVIVKRPKTSVFVDGKIYQLDSLSAMLTFPQLNIIERLRMIIVLGFLRLDPFWKPLEKIKAEKFLPKVMGKKAYDMLWGSQLTNKMGQYAKEVSLVWFWSRIVKRSPSLVYPKKGFLPFAEYLAAKIHERNGRIIYQADTEEISENEGKVSVVVHIQNGKKVKELFDSVIVTLPSALFLHITPQLPSSYREKLVQLKGLGATNLVLRLREQFLQDGTYWLSNCDATSPVMVVVEHTNFMDKRHYNNEHIIYVGKYMTQESELFKKNKHELLALYDPFLKKLNPHYEKNIIGYELFKAPFAQPIVPINYSQHIPSLNTPLPHVYLANMQQVYPWDRGTNYAVELGHTIAKHIQKNV